MSKKKKTNHQLAQIRRFRANKAANQNAKKVLDIWAKEYEKRKQVKICGETK